MDLKPLKDQILLANKTELRELRTYIKGRLDNFGSTASVQVVGEANWVEEVFVAECKRLGLDFVTKGTLNLVGKHVSTIKKFMVTACPNSSIVVQRGVLATGIDLLYQDLLSNGRLVNPRALAYGLDRLPAVLDRSFPGYAASGLLSFIVKIRRSKNDGSSNTGGNARAKRP